MTGPSQVARESAIARLIVIGPRAVERLLVVVRSSPDPLARQSGLRALEGIRDPRCVPTALDIASSDADSLVAAAAVAVARVFIRQDKSTAIVERMTTIALEPSRASGVRLAAVAALKDLGPSTVAPLLKALAADADAAIRAEASPPPKSARTANTRTSTQSDADAVLARAADEGLVDDPDRLREALASASKSAPLASLLRIAERMREREAAEPASRREPWAAGRAAAHLALAKRRSRIGVYDLREWLQTDRTPLPVDALAALSLIGDSSCLEPIAVRYAALRDEWSRTKFADVFRSIVRREALSRRHATIRRIERKEKRVLEELWPKASRPLQTRPRPARGHRT